MKRKKQDLAKRFGPPLPSEEVIKKEEEKIAKAKAVFNIDQAEVEKNLTEYLAIKDPLMHNGKAIALIRRPSMKELKALIPPEMRKYVDDPKGLPPEAGKKYEKFFYQKMSEYIVVPKKTAKEWEATINPWFIRLFFDHFAQIAKIMEGQIEGF